MRRPRMPLQTDVSGRRLALILSAMALSVLIWVTYRPTLEHGWAPLDDDTNFVYNDHFRGFSQENLRWMWTTRHMGHYIPLSWMTLAADFEVGGMEPRGYHRTNVLLHLANALLFFALSWRMLDSSSTLALWPRSLGAFSAAAFFALHPLRVESVAWITERRDVLCGLFVLLSLHGYWSAAPSIGRRRRLALVGSLFSFGAALLSKGIAVVLPIALLALDIGPLKRLGLDARRWLSGSERGVLQEKLPFLALAVLFASVTFWAIAPVMSRAETAGFEHRLLSSGFSLSFYLEKTLLPVAIPFQIPATHLLSFRADPLVAARGGGFLVVMAAAFALRRRAPAILLALAVFAAFVLPVSGLFQAGPQLAAHRYTYLAALPIALLIGAFLHASASRFGTRGLALVFLGAFGLALVLAKSAREQLALWRDEVTFCQAAVEAAPDHWPPVGALAQAYLRRDEQGAALTAVRTGRKRWPHALLLSHLEAVILSTSPDDALRDGELAMALAKQGARATGFQDPAALFALSAASAEMGDIDGAKRLLESAVVLVKAGRKPGYLPVLEEAFRQIEARGVVRMAAPQWEASLAVR